MKLKRMVMVLLTVVALMGVSFAAPAIAEEVQDEQKAQDEEPLKDEESRKDEEPLKDQGIRDSQDDEQGDNSGADPETKDPSSSVEEEEKQQEDRLKDPGIRLCDIVPTECDNTDDSQDDNNKKNEHNDPDEYPEYCNYPMLVYDPACDNNNEHSQDSDDSEDEQGHNSGARPDVKDPNPGEEEEESKEKEESSAPGEVPGEITKSAPENDASAQKPASASDEVGQIANSEATSPTVYGCPFGFGYREEFDTCIPDSVDDMLFASTIAGTAPFPDSFGGFVSLLGHAGTDALTAIGTAGLQIVIGHYVGDNLVDFGEYVGAPLGWPIQGVGYALGTAADAAGSLVTGAGQVVGAVSEGVGEVVGTVVENTVYPVLEHVVLPGVEAVVETVEKIGSAAKNIFCKFFC